MAPLVAVYALIALRKSYPKGTAVHDAMKTWHFMLGLPVLRGGGAAGAAPDVPGTGHHAAGALFHHYFLHDNTLQRMLPCSSRKNRAAS